MPTMQTDRLLLLSFVKFIRSELQDGGWTNVTVLDRFPADVNKIVEELSGQEGEIVPPIIAVDFKKGTEGRSAGLGMPEYEHTARFAIYFYALTFGQELDLRTFVAKKIRTRDIKVYDFSAVGFPGNGSEPEIARTLVIEISHMPDHMPMHENKALRYTGVMAVTMQIETS